MLRRTLLALLAATTLVAGCTSDEAPTYNTEFDVVIGSEEAPVKITEYFSTTCGHCINFARDNMPEFKAEYIDTGLVQLTLREIYGSAINIALATENRQGDYYANLTTFMTTFDGNLSDERIEELKTTFANADEAVTGRMIASSVKNATIDDIQGTPTFVFEDGTQVVGNNLDGLKDKIKDLRHAARRNK